MLFCNVNGKSKTNFTNKNTKKSGGQTTPPKGKAMGYYDIYDSNDNLIASEVWIDDGSGYDSGPARPIVVNWRKILMILMTIVGAANSFAIPLLLFANRAKFIQWGWLLAALPSVILGIPLFITGIALLSALKKVNDTDNPDDEIIAQAKAYVDARIANKTSTEETYSGAKHCSCTPVGTMGGNEIYSGANSSLDGEDISDEEYIQKKRDKYDRDTAIARVYLVLKFDKLITRLALMSYLVYPIGVLCFVAEALFGDTDAYMILVGTLNYFVFLLCVLSIWKNHKRYKRRHIEKIAKKLIRVAFFAIVIGIVVSVILISALKTSGYNILCLIAMLFDLLAMIDSATATNVTHHKKSKVHVWPIVLVTVVVGLVATCIACALSLVPGPIYDALLAYDNGTSTDLTLPITVWSICGAIAIVLIVVISIAINKKLNKKMLNNQQL